MPLYSIATVGFCFWANYQRWRLCLKQQCLKNKYTYFKKKRNVHCLDTASGEIVLIIRWKKEKDLPAVFQTAPSPPPEPFPSYPLCSLISAWWKVSSTELINNYWSGTLFTCAEFSALCRFLKMRPTRLRNASAILSLIYASPCHSPVW